MNGVPDHALCFPVYQDGTMPSVNDLLIAQAKLELSLAGKYIRLGRKQEVAAMQVA